MKSSIAQLALIAVASRLCFVAGDADDDDVGATGIPGLEGMAKKAPMKELWPWYHSADEIHNRLTQLAGHCNGADLDVSTRSEINTQGAAGVIELDVVTISRSGDQPKTKAMLIFGEHAREIISPESALGFVETLCGTGPDAKRASAVLDNVTFTIVPNANPLSRKVVEDGYYCKRTNEDGVDLNRNFGDAHRETGDQPGEEMNPGPKGFSEPESRIIKGLVDEERPDIYLSVHSGAYLLGMPYGYSAGTLPDNQADMLEALQPISEKYCKGECPFGNLARLIDYENPGCDIDYVKEQVGTPYVFTWEIYVGEDIRERYIQKARMQREALSKPDSLAQLGATGGLSLVQEGHREARLRGRGKAKHADALRLESRQDERGPEAKQSVESCIRQFNPLSEEETKDVVSRWTGAYLELCEHVAAKKQKAQSAPPSAPPSAAGAAPTSPLGAGLPTDQRKAALSQSASSLEAAEAFLSDWPSAK